MAGTAAATGDFRSIDDALENGGYVEDDEEQDEGQGGQSDAGQDDDRGPDDDQDEEQSEWKFPEDGEEFDDPAEDDAQEGDKPEEPQEGKPGTYAAHNQQVRLPDGTTTTVADLLKTGGDRHAVIEEKTKLAEAKQQFAQVNSQVRSMYEGMQKERELLATFAQQLMPKRPDPALAYTQPGDFQVLNDAYQRTVEMLNTIGSNWQQANQTMEAEGVRALNDFRAEQADRLVERAPEFRNDEYYAKFWNEAIRVGGRVYGYSAKELSEGMNDHRQYLVLRDALAYRRIKARQTSQKGLPREVGRPQRRVPQVNGQRAPQSGNAASLAAARKRFAKNPTMRNAVDLLPDD
jgi:hypothetical protein